MKKIIAVLCLIVIATMATFVCVPAFARTFEEECDTVFLKTFERLLMEESVMDEDIEIVKEPLYDISLNQMGFIYSINLESNAGFAIVINTDGLFEVAEIYLSATNPYEGYQGESVYVGLFLYLVHANGEFTETSSGVTLDNDTVALLGMKALYSASSTIYTSTEIIYYTNRTVQSYKLSYTHPAYLPVGVTNACTPAAGGNIVGYYTRFFPELMPGYTTGYEAYGYYFYYEMTETSSQLIVTLYNYMGTNSSGAGTTIAQFKSGLTRYINEKKLSIIYNSCMSGSNFNYALSKQRLESGMPVVIFVDTFTVASITNNPSYNEEIVAYTVVQACHAMAVFGYQEITYKLTNGQNRTDNYLVVASGLAGQEKGYYNINYQTTIDDAYAINIYK